MTEPILVLALGNDLIGDDAVGLLAGRAIGRRWTEGVQVMESPGGGLALLDFLAGYGRALILDSITTGRYAPGTVMEFDARDLPQGAASSPHYVGLPEVIQMAARLDIPMPGEIRVVAVEIEPQSELRTGLGDEVRGALPRFVASAEKVLGEWLPGPR